MDRWKINLYTIWVTQIVSLMSFNFGIPFMSYYIQELGVTNPSDVKMFIGLLSAAAGISAGVMAPVWGRMADKYGKKMMLLRAIIAGGVVMLGMGLSANVYQLLFFRFIQGIFTGTITASAALVASSTPENRLGFALGFLATSTQIGSSVGPALGGMVAEWFGYRNSFIFGGVLLLLDFFLVLLLVQDSNKIVEAPILDEPVEENPKKSFYGVWLLVGMILILLLRFATNVFTPYMAIFVQNKLGTLEGASRITGLMSGFIGFMTAMSGFILGRLGDRYNRLKLLKICGLMSFLIAVPLFLSGEIWILTLVYGLMMFMIGGIEPIVMSVSSSRVDRNQRGRLFGLQALVSSIAWALSPLLGSALSIQFSIEAVLMAIPIFLLAELLVIVFYGKKLLS